MEGKESKTETRKSRKVFWIVGICLFAGIGIGYLARRSSQPSAVQSQVAVPDVAQTSNVITLEKLKQESDKIVEPLLEQLQNSPENPLLLAEIGKLYYQMHRFPMAAKYYAESARLKPDAVVLIKLGGAYHFAGEDDRAIDAWQRALRLDPNNPDALFNIGYVKWHEEGDREAAIAAWQKLLNTNPNHPKRAQVEELLYRAKHPEASSAAQGNLEIRD